MDDQLSAASVAERLQAARDAAIKAEADLDAAELEADWKISRARALLDIAISEHRAAWLALQETQPHE